ncbi:MAG: class I SAM-dependent methyltransferase [Candidatus Eisenbacteria bacterium]|nr:class I SAM-dependent methyltransferase [Candidatus Eisenbacteria bacterium]
MKDEYPQHEANRAMWNAQATAWARGTDARGLWRRCHQDPSLALCPTERALLGTIAGRETCVLGSGDNEAVFALAGMGALVTSVDISDAQLDIARARAESLSLEVRFVRSDVCILTDLADESFDVVYTGGHISVWISDLRRYYAEAVRILRPHGLFLVNDYHPTRRMWHDSQGPAPAHRYFDRGPYRYVSEEGLPQYEYHWTTTDHVQAMLDAGCTLVKIEEDGEGEEEGAHAAMVPADLPRSLLLGGRKMGGGAVDRPEPESRGAPCR